MTLPDVLGTPQLLICSERRRVSHSTTANHVGRIAFTAPTPRFFIQVMSARPDWLTSLRRRLLLMFQDSIASGDINTAGVRE